MKGVEPKKMGLKEKYMREAIRQVKRARKLGEVPVGCAIVYQNRIIGRGYNRRIIGKNVLSRAEIITIKKAYKVMGDWRLKDCTMYVTLEPYPMCAGAIIQARVPHVVIDCMNPKAGCASSILDMLCRNGFNHRVETSVDMMEEEYSTMLKEFFRGLRRPKS